MRTTETFKTQSFFHAGRIIDCHGNPYDLRPATKAVVNDCCERSANLQEGTPLVILMGEDHETSAQTALQQSVLSALSGIGQNMLYAIEWRQNFWNILSGAVTHEDKATLLEKLYPHPYKTDISGRAALSMFLGYGGTTKAAAARDSVFAMCYDRNIPAIFNDPTTIKAPGGLDLDDPAIAAIARERTEREDVDDLNEIISIPDMMAIRNRGMAERAVTQARKLGVNVILQSAGQNHLFGSAPDRCAFYDSLYAAYRKAGADVLPVFIYEPKADCNLSTVPHEARPVLSQSIIIKGLATEQFDIGDINKERVYLKDQLAAYSGDAYSFYDVAPEKEFYKSAARMESGKIIEYHEKLMSFAAKPGHGST